MPYLTIFSHKRLTKEENLFDFFLLLKEKGKKAKITLPEKAHTLIFIK